MRKYFALFLQLFAFIGIFILGVGFGASVLAVMYAKPKIPWTVGKYPKFFIFAIVSITAMIFQPTLIILTCVGLVLALLFGIVCFPLVIWIVNKYRR
jgi:hypothetical protein